jgi:dTDP-4-amino-4,6-dideoxygalactose transaminase
MINENHMNVPMSSPDLNDSERQAVLEVLNTPSLSMGPKIEAFEDSFRQYTGSKYAIGVNSGTAGLHLCVHAADIQPGDFVITTPFSFVASTNVLLFENAIPIFVDVDEKTGNINPELVDQAARDISEGGRARRFWLPRKNYQSTGRLKAILAVDVFGQPADMYTLGKIAKNYHLKFIEDSCEALGAEYKHKKAGTFGDYGVFAFYPNKQITTGEGGMIITNDRKAAELMRALRNQGRAPGDTWLSHTYLGYNYRLDEMSAVLGLKQMERIDELLNKRQQVADRYAERLAEIPGVEPPVVVPSTTRISWFVYVIRLKHGIDRGKLAKTLEGKGIPVRPYFLPIHLQPYMIERFGYEKGDYPVTEDLGERGMALPFSGKMSSEQVDYVCDGLASVILQQCTR